MHIGKREFWWLATYPALFADTKPVTYTPPHVMILFSSA